MNLDKIVRQHFSRAILVPLVSVMTLYVTNGCGGQVQDAHKANLGQYCTTDYSCNGELLVCENQKCVSDKGGYCTKDNDCSGLYVCENNSCGSGGNLFNNKDGNGSYDINGDVINPSSIPVAKTPQEAYSLFKGALGKGDRETALHYISAHVQDRYQGFFSAMSNLQLEQLAQEMPSLDQVKPTYQSSTKNFVEHNVVVNGEEFAIIFKCEKNGVCTINGF